MTGIAAHIVAAAAGGQRSDASLSPAQRKAASNGIWMCAIHGKWIDDNPSIATVEKLEEWKAAHEAEIAAWVEHGYPGIFKSWDRLAALTRGQRDTIKTKLPNGHVVAQDDAKLIAALNATGSCLVSGDSGVGKSAMVKTALDSHFPEARQVWLGPEALQAALSEANREGLGLSAPLLNLLETTTAGQNILVLDAVERADAATISRLSETIASLGEDRSMDNKGWRVIAISQRAGFEVHLDPLINALSGTIVTVLGIEREQVQEALLSVPALAQLAYDDSFVALLGNLRTLGWIIAAGPLFSGADAGLMAARFQIADRLWAHWTGGDAELHSFMIALARRDAEYERSFGLSELGAAERAAWKAGRQKMPLTLSDRNRLSFEHDLASDWARYQFLKEIAIDLPRWTGLANQPLWIAALRLFGQFLLREPDQANKGWDWAFATAEAAQAPDAIDILLDALCLDPAADSYLTARFDLLFANDGKLLNRLLARFMHIATVPERPAAAAADDPGVSLYAEAEMRSPVWSAWPPLIRFLVQHRSTIAPFGSRTVAKVCEYWLTKTPTTVNGNLVLGRAGIAELALETARVDQITSIAYAFSGGRSDEATDVFSAALAGVEDRLEAVSAFALEMARRRPLAENSQAKVDALRAKERKSREEVARGKPRRKQGAPMSMSMLGYRKLPPWPLGPAGRLNDAFRTAVLRHSAAAPLMKAAPDIAAEVLLACIVDDKPHIQSGALAIDDHLGLHWEHDDRPTLFWTSPFFLFLAQSPQVALEALLRLVEFSTARWASDNNRDEPSRIALVLNDGSTRRYAGDWQVLDWSHTRRAVNSQLFAALDALERWLWMKIGDGEDVSSLCTHLLERTNSVAILGVLVDCAKLGPNLLRGPLAPLLTSPILILWDEFRLSRRFGNDAFTWYRAGERVRAIGLEWEQAAHRTISLKQIVCDFRRIAPAFDDEARRAFTAWPTPDSDFGLRQRALVAELDPINWREEPDKDGKPVPAFRFPEEIAAEIEAMRPESVETVTLGMVLKHLEGLLGAPLSPNEAAELYAALDYDEDLNHFSPTERSVVQTAIATVLLARAGDWLSSDSKRMARLVVALESSVPAFEEIEDPLDERLDYGAGLIWAMVGALYAKAQRLGQMERWDRILSFGLATGNTGIVRTIIAAARNLKSDLGLCYHAIIEVAVLSATLTALTPSMEGEPGSAEAMAVWRQRLARRPLAMSCCPTDFDLVSLAQRVERLWLSRYRRSSGKEITADGRHRLNRRYSLGIGAHLLTATFAWVLQDDIAPATEDLAEHRRTIRMLWDFVAWRLRGDPYEPLTEHDGYDRLDDFGLTMIRTIAARIPLGHATESRLLWEPVLALGPRGEFTVEHMIDLLFLRLYKEIDAANFVANWDAMLAYVFTPGWLDVGKFWRGRSILQHMLGLNAASQIANVPDVLAHVEVLAPYFKAFARDHLPHDHSTLASFARFFASTAGASLRLDAIRWIDTALCQETSKLRDNAGSDLADLVRILLGEHSAELVANREARDALNRVIARMARDQAPYALTLQDRARALR